jgi:hypothetical protein
VLAAAKAYVKPESDNAMIAMKTILTVFFVNIFVSFYFLDMQIVYGQIPKKRITNKLQK